MLEVALDAVQHRVHKQQPVCVGHQLHAVERLRALEPLQSLGRHIGGGGGGRPTLAEAGGKNPEGLRDALAAGKKAIAEALT